MIYLQSYRNKSTAAAATTNLPLLELKLPLYGQCCRGMILNNIAYYNKHINRKKIAVLVTRRGEEAMPLTAAAAAAAAAAAVEATFHSYSLLHTVQ